MRVVPLPSVLPLASMRHSRSWKFSTSSASDCTSPLTRNILPISEPSALIARASSLASTAQATVVSSSFALPCSRPCLPKADVMRCANWSSNGPLQRFLRSAAICLGVVAGAFFGSAEKEEKVNRRKQRKQRRGGFMAGLKRTDGKSASGLLGGNEMINDSVRPDIRTHENTI